MNELLNSDFSYVMIAAAVGILITIVLTILCCIMVIPEKKYKSLPKFFQVLSDIFNFKSLLLEKIVKVLYIFLTFACIFIGFLMIFWFKKSYFGEIQWYGGFGLVLMILGPILLRVFHEAVMLVILLVKNTAEINEQLKKNNADNDEAVKNNENKKADKKSETANTSEEISLTSEKTDVTDEKSSVETEKTDSSEESGK